MPMVKNLLNKESIVLLKQYPNKNDDSYICCEYEFIKDEMWMKYEEISRILGDDQDQKLSEQDIE